MEILPGQYFDAETGLHQNWNRDYDPSIGRYLQSDPVGLRAGVNTYGYVRQNPLRRTDRRGLSDAGDFLGPLIFPNPAYGPAEARLPTDLTQLKDAQSQSCESDEFCRNLDQYIKTIWISSLSGVAPELGAIGLECAAARAAPLVAKYARPLCKNGLLAATLFCGKSDPANPDQTKWDSDAAEQVLDDLRRKDEVKWQSEMPKIPERVANEP